VIGLFTVGLVVEMDSGILDAGIDTLILLFKACHYYINQTIVFGVDKPDLWHGTKNHTLSDMEVICLEPGLWLFGKNVLHYYLYYFHAQKLA